MITDKNSKWIKPIALVVFVLSIISLAFSLLGAVLINEAPIPSGDPWTIKKTLYDNVARETAFRVLADEHNDNIIQYEGLNIALLKSENALDIDLLKDGRFKDEYVVAGTVDRDNISGVMYGHSDWRYEWFSGSEPFRSALNSNSLYISIPRNIEIDAENETDSETLPEEESEIYDYTEDVYFYSDALERMDDEGTKYYVLYSIDYNAGKGTYFESTAMLVDYIIWSIKYSAPVIVLSVLIAIISFVLLMMTAKKTVSGVNKIPLLINLTAFGLFETCCITALVAVLTTDIYIHTTIALSVIVVAAGAVAFAAFFMDLATRIKSKTLFSTLFMLIGFARENTPLVVKVIIFSVVLGIIQIGGLAVVANEADNGMILFVIYKIIGLGALIWLAIQIDRVLKGAARVASGDTSDPIETSHMLPAFRAHALNINNVGNGISAAVEEKMKSERMKTELITNVSHDIKTPLTSIINYVGLMEKHGTDDPEMKEYMDVLDRQSDRLKKLIEDLIEASKASSGNIEMSIEPVNLGLLLSQAVGEFEQKLNDKELNSVVNVPEEELIVKADGRYLWRVIDNLMSNICKYAMPNTRVYVDLTEKGNSAELAFKNISATELNISPEELTERFVRGDSSRNSEGSGLGLSIAKSLTELMGGTLDISIDGDLFKATITLPKA